MSASGIPQQPRLQQPLRNFRNLFGLLGKKTLPLQQSRPQTQGSTNGPAHDAALRRGIQHLSVQDSIFERRVNQIMETPNISESQKHLQLGTLLLEQLVKKSDLPSSKKDEFRSAVLKPLLSENKIGDKKQLLDFFRRAIYLVTDFNPEDTSVDKFRETCISRMRTSFQHHHQELEDIQCTGTKLRPVCEEGSPIRTFITSLAAQGIEGTGPFITVLHRVSRYEVPESQATYLILFMEMVLNQSHKLAIPVLHKSNLLDFVTAEYTKCVSEFASTLLQTYQTKFNAIDHPKISEKLGKLLPSAVNSFVTLARFIDSLDTCLPDTLSPELKPFKTSLRSPLNDNIISGGRFNQIFSDCLPPKELRNQ